MTGWLNGAPLAPMPWGQSHIETGPAAIPNAATAVFAPGVAALALRDERITPRRALGVGPGFPGVAATAAIGSSALPATAAACLPHRRIIAAAGAGFSPGPIPAKPWLWRQAIGGRPA